MSTFDMFIEIIENENKKRLDNKEEKRLGLAAQCEAIKLKIKNIIENADLKEQMKKGVLSEDKKSISFFGHIDVATEIIDTIRELSLEGYVEFFKDNEFYNNLTNRYGCPQYKFDINRQCPEFVEFCTKNDFVYTYDTETLNSIANTYNARNVISKITRIKDASN